MRTAGGVPFSNGSNGRIKRGSVKAFRVGANGKPIRTNSLARIATMKADKESLNNRGRPLRRSNSSSNLANRLGPRRPTVGGAAQRVAQRNLDRQRRQINAVNGRGRSAGNNNRGRSRSRSRTRAQPGDLRSRSRSRNAGEYLTNNRNRSRNRYRPDIANAPPIDNSRRGRSRSRSRSRGRADFVNKSNLPIKARLGVRAGAPGNNGPNNRRRNASITRRGVRTGRVQKRRNSTNANTAGSDNIRRGRNRSRSDTRNARNANVRSGSRTRKGQLSQRRQQGQQGQRNGRAPRGRSVQRRGNNISKNNGQTNLNNSGKVQNQQRRRRSLTRRGSSNGVGSRNQGNKIDASSKQAINKDDLDKELDQYMATTKTENEMDYLLKN